VILALPLRKDQPMETYVGALISFYILKPRKRLWQPDGLDRLVEITAPKTVEPERAKDISGDEARARLDYLSGIVDSRGWSLRGQNVASHGMTSPVQQPALNPYIYDEAEQTADMFEENSARTGRIESMIERQDARLHQQVLSSFQQQAAAAPPPAAIQPTPTTAPVATPDVDDAAALAAIRMNPYPEQMRQKVISPEGTTPTTPPIATQPATQQLQSQQPIMPTPAPESTSVKEPSPDIIDLANNSGDMTIATIAHEAERRRKKAAHEHGLPDGEVEISLH
jgi:hypothetical protein